MIMNQHPTRYPMTHTPTYQVLFLVGATRRDRTGDLLITNQPLYQLS
jgi:hypothetical protein